MAEKIRVTVWSEYILEKEYEHIAAIYPKGIHEAIADIYREDAEFEVRAVTLQMPEQGLGEEVLSETDVLLWYGHMVHEQVEDKLVERIKKRVWEGMGLLLLHSSAQSKVFDRILGTTGDVRWREIGEKERVWVIDRSHPIVQGLPMYFDIPHSEMYGEPFEIPVPEELVFISWFAGGDVLRSGCCYHRGAGKVFYFGPGHEEYPIYYQKEIRQVMKNAVQWAAPGRGVEVSFGKTEALEDVEVFSPR